VILLSFQIPLFESNTILPVVQAILITLIPLTIGAGIIGTLFGFLTARGLTRRLQNITQAANAWSEGDFSVTTWDPSGDELGQLNRTLTSMAEQLQNLLATHQELAMLEERNRLARELHDTVKQQVFATAMQLGTAKTLVDSDPQAAREHIIEAEQLVRQSQRELTGLIQELRPAGLEGKELAEAVRELADDWSRRTGIATVVQVRGERPLPLISEKTLFRVTQEALAKVARHSNAGQVTIRIFWQADGLLMEINDDGTGFDPAAQKMGVGLAGMAERIAALSGSMTIDSAPGRGTTIGVAVPLGQEREQI
jgi:NarL family two-component system sensor histidine kinase LiaS